MPIFFESLEPRTFLSGTPATAAALAADQARLFADAASATTALQTLIADTKADIAAITVDLKSLPASNASLLKTLKTDEARAEATVKADLNLLTKPGIALAKKSASTGDSLLTKATVKTVAVAAVDITALGTVAATPLANLTAALHANVIGADLQALATANPAATQLAADVAAADAVAPTTALRTSAAQFSADITTLAADLSSIQTAFGTFPNMVGTLNGTALVTRGQDLGKVSTLSFLITHEDAAGNLAGTVTNFNNGDTFSLIATVTLNGKVAGKLKSAQHKSLTFAAQFAAGTLAGTYKASDHSGTFTVVEAP
jgi:hypothetical protein